MKWLRRLFAGQKGRPAATPADASPAGPVPVDTSAGANGKKELTLRQGAPEFDLFIARGTLDLGENLAHGAQHLAALLALDPADRDWRALVDRYVDAARPDIDGLVPDTEPRYASTEALRAYLWQMQGRTVDAVARLIEVSKAQGNALYLHAWVLEWLEPAGMAESLPEHTGVMLLGTVLTHCEEAHISSAKTSACMLRWARLSERVVPRYAESGLSTMIRAGLLRKAGLYDEALAVAGPIEQATEFNQAAAIGLALRRKGLYGASAQAFAAGLKLAPDVIAGHLEAGDSHFEGGDWQKALAWYESAMQLEPAHAWAEPSAWFCRWKLDGDEAWMTRLTASTHEGNRRAHELLFRVHGALAEPGDASANVLRQMRAAWLKKAPAPAGSDDAVSLKVSTMEAPSNRLAFTLEMAAFGQRPRLKVSVASVPSIDPRRPVADVRYLLWRFEGTDPYPGLQAPSAEVSACIAGLATERFDPHVNWAHASHVALALGPQCVQDILAVMVHPPAMPPGVHALAWLPRVQLAAAQVLGQIDGGWEGSVRREALLSVLHGPWDWTTSAAIRVLAWIGREEPVHALEIHRAFEHLDRHVPSQGHWDWISVLYREWPTLPYLFDTEREAIRAKAVAWDD